MPDHRDAAAPCAVMHCCLVCNYLPKWKAHLKVPAAACLKRLGAAYLKRLAAAYMTGSHAVYLKGLHKGQVLPICKGGGMLPI